MAGKVSGEGGCESTNQRIGESRRARSVPAGDLPTLGDGCCLPRNVSKKPYGHRPVVSLFRRFADLLIFLIRLIHGGVEFGRLEGVRHLENDVRNADGNKDREDRCYPLHIDVGDITEDRCSYHVYR